ncbi:myosin light chain kinase, smooth muscle-like isoform X2 [Arapaima gigas]
MCAETWNPRRAQRMGDIQLATTTHVAKVSLTLGRGSLRSEPPAFTLPPRNVRVSQGGTARLECTVRGCPEPQVRWYKDGKSLTPGDHLAMEQGSRGAFSLVVPGVREEDGGRYTCEAVNDGGSRQVTVTLTVEGKAEKRFGLPSVSRTAGGRVPMVENRPSIWGESPPKFVTKPSRLFINVGQSGKFSAKITGRPQPQVVWFKGEVELQHGGRFSTSERSGVHFLEVSDARAEDAGMYTCTVVNSAGKATATAELTIQGRDQSSADQPIATYEKNILETVVEDTKIYGAVVPAGTVPKTTESPADRHTSNGLIASLTSPRTPEQKEEKETHTSDTGTSRSPKPISEAGHSQVGVPQRRADSDGPHSSQSIVTASIPLGRESGGEPRPDRRWGSTPLPAKEPTCPDPERGTTKFVRESRVEDTGSAPQFGLQPQSQEVMEGAKVTFRCQVSGTPAPTLSWIKDGSVLRGGPGVKIQREGDLHLLTLESVRKGDSGSYGCAASNSRGQASATWTLVVKSCRAEGSAPVFSSVLEDRVVSEGQGFVLRCAVQGRPPPHISWLLNDQPIPQSRCWYEGGEAQLEVQAALREDGGLYTCVAENLHGRAACSTKVLIRERRTPERTKPNRVGEVKKPLAPAFLRGLEDLKVMDGSRVTMTVEVTGYPQPRVAWLHNGQEIQESEDFHFERRGKEYSLVIQEVFPEDTGRFTCEAWNELGGAHTEAVLTVQEPQDGVQPWFISKPKSTSANLGEHALLSCAIAGDPFPQFLWKKDGQVLSSGVDFELLQKEDVVTLLIRRVKAHHAGEYEISLKYGLLFGLLAASPCWGSNGVRRGASSVVSKHPPSLVALSVLLFSHGTQEAEQLDFRSVLGRSVATKSLTEEDLKEIVAEQMDFRANLQRQVKPKTLSEDERKISSPQQVDFRAVLGKKGGGVPKIGSDKGEPQKNAATDFRSVLGNKKKPPVPTPVENNVASPVPNDPALKGPVSKGLAPKEKPEKEVNCVDAGINGSRSGDTGKAPEFMQKLRDITVLDGECLRLECEVSAEPPATITWTLDGKIIKPSKFILLSQEGGHCSLTIDKALPEDEGQYKCRAENTIGRAECECMVLVDGKTLHPTDTSSPPCPYVSDLTCAFCGNSVDEARIKKKPAPKTPPKQAIPPQIIQFPEDMKILAGQDVNLLCKFAGAPPITCTWLKFRKPIEGGTGNITINSTESTSQLTISPTKPDHCGCYTIELQNKAGTRQASLNLTIVDKPDPPARVPAASDIRQSSLTLSWYGPTYDGGSVVQSYNLEIWNSVDQEWKPLVSCNSTSYNVQDLLPDRQYKFRVRAVNIYGIGEPSAESDPVTVGVEEGGEHPLVVASKCPLLLYEEKQEYRDVVIKTNQTVKDFYDVEERLGTGKFGQVFKLVEKATKKVWAGKFIKAFSAKDKESVRQEIGIMNCLHHPKLVQCVDAFEGKSDIVMVMEMISGGELFERIIDEDFELTEREVIKYMLQIIDGVQFIHKQGIVHLDLKPENIMCVNKTGTKIKLIDFGLARRLENSGSLKVLFGTPEFVAPEVINYEPIGYPTDMWSIGVICYILVSGLSPFMGDNDNETLSNVTSASWDFEDEAFDEISEEAKDFISRLLKKNLNARLTCAQCLEHAWLKQDTKNMEAKKLSKERMKKYLLRRKWQKTGHAVRAIGRLSSMAMLSGIGAKKGGSPTGNPTEDDLNSQLLESAEDEERPPMKPYFSTVIKDVEVVEGSAARFDCKIEGYPDPEVVWYKDDQPIKETRHFQIDYDEDGNCSLVISEVTSDDDAKYTCKAVNSLGEAMCTADLLVEFMAEEEGEEGEEGEGEEEE